MLELHANDALAFGTIDAIHRGDAAALESLLRHNPGLATARILAGRCQGGGARTLLHIATDYPGNFPNGPAIVETLVAAGADVNARFGGAHTETPLHWAASCDDVAVLDKLLDLGADIEATGAVIAGGTPLADAVAFGQWKTANRLIERGAKANLCQAAALGLMDRVAARFSEDPQPTPDEVTQAFWLACHGGQRTAAEYLLARGADINWIGCDNLTPLGAAERSEAVDLAVWLKQNGGK